MADVDVISDLLKKALEVFPSSNFIQSLSHQYLVRGWLSKKQMEGLYDKLCKSPEIPPGKLATLEAQILKMPTRYRSEKPAEITPLYEKDERVAKLFSDILSRYPQHKRVVFLSTKFNNNEPLSPSELSEVEKFHKLLVGKRD
jgi:hypothetical protein